MNRVVYVEVGLLFRGDDPYYSDDELPFRAENWIESALEDRDDLIDWSIDALPTVHTNQERL